MKKIAFVQMFFLVFLSGLLATASLHAQAAKNYFDGKTISFLVGSTAGGGSDLMARLVARHFERHIPGKPRIDIINKPGAGGLIAANELYNLRKPDGLSIAAPGDFEENSRLALA